MDDSLDVLQHVQGSPSREEIASVHGHQIGHHARSEFLPYRAGCTSLNNGSRIDQRFKLFVGVGLGRQVPRVRVGGADQGLPDLWAVFSNYELLESIEQATVQTSPFAKYPTPRKLCLGPRIAVVASEAPPLPCDTLWSAAPAVRPPFRISGAGQIENSCSAGCNRDEASFHGSGSLSTSTVINTHRWNSAGLYAGARRQAPASSHHIFKWRHDQAGRLVNAWLDP